MSFVSFLKKVGLGIIKYVPLVLGAGSALQPIIQAQNPSAGAAVDKLDTMIGAGLSVEQMFAAAYSGAQTGPQKLLALKSQVVGIVQNMEIVVQHKVANEALFEQACQEFAQATADLLNSLQGKDGSTVTAGLQTVSK